jgi:Na+/melibiose symporter-like transporter
MKANSRVQGLGFSVQRFVIKFTLLLMVVFTGFAAYADVPPPTKTDTVLKAAGFNESNEVMAQPIEMATGMRSSGKIYVVVAVLSMVLIGLIIYLFTLDRKISKLEKENK